MATITKNKPASEAKPATEAKPEPKLNKAANAAARKAVMLFVTTDKAEATYIDARLALSVEVAKFWKAAEAAGFPNFKAAATACTVKGWPGYEALKKLKSVGCAELEEKGAGMAKLQWLRMKSAEASAAHRDGKGEGKPGPLGQAMDKIRGLSEKARSETLRTLASENDQVVMSKSDATELHTLRENGEVALASADDIIAAFAALKPAERSKALAGILQVMGSLDGSK